MGKVTINYFLDTRKNPIKPVPGRHKETLESGVLLYPLYMEVIANRRNSQMRSRFFHFSKGEYVDNFISEQVFEYDLERQTNIGRAVAREQRMIKGLIELSSPNFSFENFSELLSFCLRGFSNEFWPFQYRNDLKLAINLFVDCWNAKKKNESKLNYNNYSFLIGDDIPIPKAYDNIHVFFSSHPKNVTRSALKALARLYSEINLLRDSLEMCQIEFVGEAIVQETNLLKAISDQAGPKSEANNMRVTKLSSMIGHFLDEERKKVEKIIAQ